MSSAMFTEFVSEADNFFDEFWADAEKLDYKKADALRLVSYFFFAYCEAHPADRDSVLRNFEHQIEKPPSEAHEMLGNALAMYSLATTEHSIKYLILAWRCLEAFRKEGGAVNLLSDITGEAMTKALSEMGRKGAEARHEETHKLKAEVQNYWREKIEISMSNEKAAAELIRVFPLAFRTLRDYIAEAKREAKQSAGTV